MDRNALLDNYRYLLEMNYKIAETKEELEKSKNRYLESLKKEEECKKEWGTATLLMCTVPMLLAGLLGLGVVIIGGSILISFNLLDQDLWRIEGLCFGGALLSYGIADLIITISYAKNDRDRNALNSAVTHNCEVLPAYAEYKSKEAELGALVETSMVREIENTIPKDYKTESAVKFLSGP